VLNALGSFEMRDSECAVKQERPYFLFLEGPVFLVPDCNLISETIVDILEDEDNFIKSGAESVVDFSVGFL
jgi:hypothetical protein